MAPRWATRNCDNPTCDRRAGMAESTMMRISYEYYSMVMQWEEICSRSIGDIEKTKSCLSLLEEFIGRLALCSKKSPHPPERFYAYMVALEALVRPELASDTLGQLAVVPSHRVVTEWIVSSTLTRT